MKSSAILLAIAVAVGASSVAAQGLGRLLKDTGLVNADFAMMKEAAATLYENEPREVGSAASWENPETGASGTVELTHVDGRCVDLRHVFKASPQARTDGIRSRRCRNEAGDWTLNLDPQ